MDQTPREGETQQTGNKMKQWIKNLPSLKRKPILITLLLLSLGLLGLLVLFNRSNISFEPKPEYTVAYTLVAPSVSESANVIIHLPKGVSEDTVKDRITFHPEISGTWVADALPDTVTFDPKNTLKVGKYYTVTLTTEEGVIGKDFLVDEDPSVAAVFPRENTETHEKTNITVVFNRPMIPVSTVDKKLEKEVPLTIEPATPGKFKWVGTRTVQFIPDTTLKASTQYRVSIPENVPSLEGVRIASVAPVMFTTRHLRYNGITDGTLRYNQPIRIQFNQPVDREKTAQEIRVTKSSGEEEVEVSVEYGTKTVYNAERKMNENVLDESSLVVIQKKDAHGRKNLWDFTLGYAMTIKKAYPKDGDIPLTEEKTAYANITDVVESWGATSPRTNFATPDFFDPEGVLTIKFFEDIDLSKSAIDAPHITSLTYGEKCKEDGEGETFFYSDVPCEKVADKRTVLLKVNKEKFALGDSFQLSLKRVVNMSGLVVNPNVITKSITLPPRLQVRLPFNEKIVLTEQPLKIQGLVFCTNSPIGKDGRVVVKNITAEPAFEKMPIWQQSYFIKPNEDPRHYLCNPGEYQTTLSYGLAPETTYKLSVPVEDPFGSKQTVPVSFVTEPMPAVNLLMYHLQGQYVVTTPEKTKLSYASENMEYMDVHVCKVAPETLLKYATVDRPSYLTGPSGIGSCLKAVSKRLPIAKHFWVKNYTQFDLKDFFPSDDILGSYVVTLSHPNYRDQYRYDGEQIFERTLISVTNLSIVEKNISLNPSAYAVPLDLTEKEKQSLSNLFWVTNNTSLAPAQQAKISFFTSKRNYSGQGSALVESGTSAVTGNDGLATATPLTDYVGAIVTTNNESTILPSDSVKLLYSSTALQSERLYIYTDRPIYRPLHTVHVKGLYRSGYDGAYEIRQDKKVTVKVHSPMGTELLSEEVSVSDFGTFETEVTLPQDAALGTYRIQVGEFGFSSFEVEEYVPAAFQVEAKAGKSEYLSADTVTVDIDAKYYFGASVEGGTVEYSIGSQNYYFDKYTDEYFSFGSGWYSCYNNCYYGDKFVLRNRVPLGTNGKARISHVIDLKKMFPNEADRGSKIMVMYVTVKNANGQSVTNQVSFVVHAGEYYLGLATDKFFATKNESIGIRAKSVNTEGKPVRVRDLTLSWNKISYNYNKRQEVDGAFYYQWEEKKVSVHEETLSTDGDGNWSGNYTPSQEGEYELLLQGTDSRGNTISTRNRIYVSSYESTADDLVRPGNDTNLELVPLNQEVKVGDTASFIIKSPFKQGKALVTVERGQIFTREIIDVAYGLQKYSFPVTEAYVPNIFASVTLLSGNPEVKSGNTVFRVNTDKKEIDIVAKATKEQYLPGEEVTLSFTAKDSSGKPIETEFSAAVVDMSVLALKGNPKKNPLLFFYDGFPLTVSTASNIKNILQQIDVPNNTKGGGGGEPGDLATKKRGKFEDTAFWQGTVRTNKNGQATVTFRLPDNLTTWQLETVGITKDTKVGVAYDEFVAKKNVMLVPVHPRFALPGDEFMIGAKVFNQTNARQSFTVSYVSTDLPLVKGADAKRTVTLRANETRTIYFPVAPGADRKDTGARLTFTLSAKNSRYEDTVEQSLLLSENATYETVATAGISEAPALRESLYVPGNIIPNKGEVTIKSSATLALFLSDALTYLIQYPYSSAEEIATKLEAIAIYKEALALKNVGSTFSPPTTTFEGITYTMDEVVDLSLAKLYKKQLRGGGYSYYDTNYWYNYQGDPYLTARVVRALERIKNAGYSIDTDRQEIAFHFLLNDFLYYTRNSPSWYEKFIVQAGALYELKDYGTIPKTVPDQIRRIVADEKYLQDRIGTQSLALLSNLLHSQKREFGARTANKILDLLENRIEVDARGAYVKPNAELSWTFYETTIRNTALLLKAEVNAERVTEVTPNIIRWLLASRSKDGAWGSTMNTISAVDALVQYLAYTRETESNFTLTTVLPTEKSDTTTFNKETLFQTRVLRIPNSQILKDALMTIEFKKEDHNRLKNNLYYDIAFRYFLPIGTVAPRDEGFAITRTMYQGSDTEQKNPVSGGKAGDVLKVTGEIIVPRSRNYVSVEDYIPAGAEIVNFNLQTENRGAFEERAPVNDPYADFHWNGDISSTRSLNPEIMETRDDRVYMVKQHLEPGIYTYEYYLRLLVPGTFQHLPAVVSEKYFPENFGRTGGNVLTITE